MILTMILRFGACLAIAILLVGWMVWGSQTIGNDYVVWPNYPNLVGHFYSTLCLPQIWYPYYTGGFPFGGLPGIQVFHLPNWILTQIPGYTTGNAVTINAGKHCLIFAISHWIAATFLATFCRIKYLLAFIFAGAIIYNMRSLDQLRYGIYLDAVFYFQAALLLALLYLRSLSPWTLLSFGIAVQLCLTAGHPPSIFYAITILALLFIFALPQTLREQFKNLKFFALPVLYLAVVAVIGAMLAAPNFMPASEMLAMNSARVHNSTIEWSRNVPLNWIGVFDNFFLPWEAEVHSAFGGTTAIGILYIAAIIWAVGNFRRLWWMLPVMLFPFIYSFGGTLFEFFYNHIPGYRWIRIPGRILALQPTLMFCIAAVAFSTKFITKDCTFSFHSAIKIAAAINLVILIAVLGSSLLYPTFNAIFTGIGFTPIKINPWTPTMQQGWIIIGVSIAVATLIALSSRSEIQRTTAQVIVIFLFCGQSFLIFRYGSWLSGHFSSTTTAEFKEANNLPFYHTSPLLGPIELDENVGGMATTGYTRFIKSAGAQADCYLPIPNPSANGSRRTLLPFFLSRRLVLDSNGNCPIDLNAEEELLRNGSCTPTGGSQVVVASNICALVERNDQNSDLLKINSANQLIGLTPHSATLTVNASDSSILVTPYPWTPGYWHVEIDGTEHAGFMVNAGMLGVLVPPGSHTIDIRYLSARSHLARYIVMVGCALATCSLIAIILRQRKFHILPTGLAIIFLMFTVIAYRWAEGFEEQWRSKILMKNNYAQLLSEQIKNWSQVDP